WRGGRGGWDGPEPPGQGRGLPVSSGAPADRTPAGRVARVVVHGRRRGVPPSGPDRGPARGRRPAARRARGVMSGADAPTWPAVLRRLIGGEDLSTDEVRWA